MGAVYICAFARHPPSLALGMSRSKALGRSKLSTMLYLFMMSSERLRTTLVEGKKKFKVAPTYLYHLQHGISMMLFLFFETKL